MWDDLTEPWRACLDLAWEAYGAGTIPVGAVLTNAEDTIVATGRNRVYEPHAPDRQIARSLLAHAEVNALLGLDPERRYEDHVLYTTLEPCVLCVGATVMATVGTIRYAGGDPYGGGSEGGLTANPQVSRVPLALEGPLDHPAARLAAALIPAFYLRRKPDGHVVRAYDEDTLGFARALLDAGAPEEAASGTPLTEFLAAVEPAI